MTGEHHCANDTFKKGEVKSERRLEETDLRYADSEDSVAQLLPHKQPKNLGGGGDCYASGQLVLLNSFPS